MKLISDTTHRFARRPHYEPRELDMECEDLVSSFLRDRYSAINFPISTEDLTLLIERDTDDLDSAADLADLGDDVEGVTDFFRDKKPRVRIAAHLWEGPSRENRLRTTLAHEFGHVHFHNYLYHVEAGPELFTPVTKGHPLRCKRQTVHGTPSRDWMEWQAGYASGALLMPVSFARRIADATLKESGLIGPVATESAEGSNLIARIAGLFQISLDAARVRLSQLAYLTDAPIASLPLRLG
jgi:hypothetical protein